MFLRPRRLGWGEGTVSSIRRFSISPNCLEGNSNPSGPNRPLKPGSPISSHRPQSRRTNIPPANLNSKNTNTDKPRPRRIIDARSLAARQNTGQPSNILRSSGLRTPPSSSLARARKPNTPSKKTAAPKARKAARSKNPRNADLEEGDDAQKTEIESVFRELSEKNKPSPSRYRPEPPSPQNLSETWPSLPTDITAHTAGVLEKLSLLSDRSPNGYIPPTELGKRLFEGKYVRFLSEEEKAEAIAVAQDLSGERADKMSQRKGDLVEPNPVNFKQMGAEHQKALLESLVQGKYSTLEIKQSEKPPVVSEILRNLRNNETYQAGSKSSKFITKVESLLSASRPVKRA